MKTNNYINNSLQLIQQTNHLISKKDIKQLEPNIIINDNKVEYTNDTTISQINIPYNEYQKPSAYFNNLKGTVEYNNEYICHINSLDRDIYKYPNPFNFLIKCSPNPDNTDAYINRVFKNVRFIKIDTAILPRKFYLIKKKIDNDEIITNLFNINIKDNQIIDNKYIIIYRIDIHGKCIINYTDFIKHNCEKMDNVYECIKDNDEIITYQYNFSDMTLDNDKFTLLYLNDIYNLNNLSTNDKISKAFNILYPINILKESIYTDTLNNDKIYKFTELGNINRLLIKLTNSLGKDLTTNILAQDFNTPGINNSTCTCTTDQHTGNIIRDYKCICSYIRHPRYINTQINIIFKFGIIETDFDKRAFN